MQLKVVGDGVYGTSYHFLDTANYIKKEADGFFNAKTKKLIIQEGAITSKLLVDRCQICVKKFQFLYRKEGDKEFLDGFWTGKLQGTDIDCGTGGTITLSRTFANQFKEEKLPIIAIDTGKVELRFYDTGTIDGDSITVLIDGRTVLSHELLSDKPVKTTIQIDPEKHSLVMEMIADSEGTIPPNSALLDVVVGEVYHRVFLNAAKNKSAKVRFVFDREEAKKQPQVGVRL